MRTLVALLVRPSFSGEGAGSPAVAAAPVDSPVPADSAGLASPAYPSSATFQPAPTVAIINRISIKSCCGGSGSKVKFLIPSDWLSK